MPCISKKRQNANAGKLGHNANARINAIVVCGLPHA
jgi:hypothetical protein